MLPALFCSHADRQPYAVQLAERYGFTVIEQLPEHGHALVLDEAKLALHSLGKGAAGPVYVDFGGGAADWRRKHGGGLGQGVAKACGLKAGARPRILDATAGLGRDAFVLATLGCQVDMLERSPLAAAMLADGLLRAGDQAELVTIAERMSLRHGPAVQLLGDWQGERPEVIYLDPMFPETRSKSALSKKEMQTFQQLIGPDEDADELLAPAYALASGRVVVKRPRHAPLLAGAKPSYSLEGDSVRFDCYIVQRSNP